MTEEITKTVSSVQLVIKVIYVDLCHVAYITILRFVPLILGLEFYKFPVDELITCRNSKKVCSRT